MDPVSLILTLCVIGVVAWLAFWVIGKLPEPIHTPALVIVAVLILLILVSWLAGLLGHPLFHPVVLTR